MPRRFDDPDAQDIEVRIELRVPGPWRSTTEVLEALRSANTGYTFGTQGSDDEGMLIHPESGARFGIGHTNHDDDIVHVFAGTEHPPSDEELAEIALHAVKIHLIGPGGSIESARAMMQAATALVKAGGSGVFIDSSGAAHGRTDWLALAGDTKPGGLYWGFVTVTGSQQEVFSAGMHCLGFRDAEMPGPHADPNYAGFAMHNFLGYVYQSGVEVKDGDPIGDEDGATHIVRYAPCTRFKPTAPFHNPFGIFRLEKIEE